MLSAGKEWAFQWAYELMPQGWCWECVASPRFDSLEEAQRWVDEGPPIEVGPERLIGLPARTLEGRP